MPARNRMLWRCLLGHFLFAVVGGQGGIRAEGLRMGKAAFFPSYQLQAGSDSNIFNRADIPESGLEEIADKYATMELPLIWVLPFRESAWRFGYTPGYNAYQTNDFLNGLTHQANTELELNFSSGARFRLEGAYRLDYLNTDFSAGEVAFNAADYIRTDGLLEYRHPFARQHAIRLMLERDTLTFDQDANPTYTDYKYLDFTMSYLYLLTDNLTLYVEGVFSDNEQERVIFEVGEDHWRRRAAEVRLDQEYDRRNRTRYVLGYEKLSFDASDDSDFSGIVGEILYQQGFGARLEIQAELARRSNPSVFNVNNFFLTHIARAGGTYRPASKVFFPFLLSYQQNRYPDETQACFPSGSVVLTPNPDNPTGFTASCTGGNLYVLGDFWDTEGEMREDFLLSAQFGIGFQINRSASIALTYDYLNRDSNMRQFDYTTQVVTLEFRFGWSPDRDFM